MAYAKKTLGERVAENAKAIRAWPKWMQDTARFEGERSQYWHGHRYPKDEQGDK